LKIFPGPKYGVKAKVRAKVKVKVEEGSKDL
jgi:hypothetical protein